MILKVHGGKIQVKRNIKQIYDKDIAAWKASELQWMGDTFIDSLLVFLIQMVPLIRDRALQVLHCGSTARRHNKRLSYP